MRHAVLFRGFWPSFTPICAPAKFFLEIIRSIYPEDEVVVAKSVGEATILFESCFDGSALGWKRWHKTFLFSGESYNLPNWRDYDIVFSGESTTHPNVVPLPLFQLYLLDLGEPPPPLPETHIKPIPEKDVLVMISNPNGQVRSRFLQALEQSNLKITYAGRYKNNIGGPFKPAFGTHEFTAFASQFKFVITMENSQQEGYITEKILQGIFAENIPIYWGSPRICEYFNKERFLLLEDDPAATIAAMERIAADPEAWLRAVRQPWQGPLADTLTPTCLAGQCILKFGSNSA